jgi:hypothetical protein
LVKLRQQFFQDSPAALLIILNLFMELSTVTSAEERIVQFEARKNRSREPSGNLRPQDVRPSKLDNSVHQTVDRTNQSRSIDLFRKPF